MSVIILKAIKIFRAKQDEVSDLTLCNSKINNLVFQFFPLSSMIWQNYIPLQRPKDCLDAFFGGADKHCLQIL